jgi:hypothetical protein
VVAHHEHLRQLGECKTHVEVLVQSVDGVGTGGIGGRRQDVGVLHHDDDIGRVASAGALRVIRVDRPTLDRCERRLDVPALVQSIGMDIDLNQPQSPLYSPAHRTRPPYTKTDQ